MTLWLSLALYLLGVVGAASSVSRDAYGRNVPAGLREWGVVVFWPIAVAAAICLGLLTAVRSGFRP